jgi:hypothetical protein
MPSWRRNAFRDWLQATVPVLVAKNSISATRDLSCKSTIPTKEHSNATLDSVRSRCYEYQLQRTPLTSHSPTPTHNRYAVTWSLSTLAGNDLRATGESRARRGGSTQKALQYGPERPGSWSSGALRRAAISENARKHVASAGRQMAHPCRCSAFVACLVPAAASAESSASSHD